MKKIGLVIVIAALLVNGPRLIKIYLAVDGLAMPTAIEAGMMAVTGIATGVVLTGGGMYIAHVVAELADQVRSRLDWLWLALLSACWAALLAFAVVLIAPALVAGIRATELSSVLSTSELQWSWSVVAVLAVEVLAAGSMVAHALLPGPSFEPAPAGQEEAESTWPTAGEWTDAELERLAEYLLGSEPARPPATELQQEEPAAPQSIPCRNASAGCPETFEREHAERGHQAHCEYKHVAAGTNGTGVRA